MRRPVVEPDQFRLRQALRDADSGEDIDESTLPDKFEGEIGPKDIEAAESGVRAIMLRQKRKNIQRRAKINDKIFGVIDSILIGLEERKLDDIKEAFAGQDVKRAIKSINELSTTLKKLLDLVGKEEELVKGEGSMLSGIPDDRIDEILMHMGEDNEEYQEPEVVEFDDYEIIDAEYEDEDDNG